MTKLPGEENLSLRERAERDFLMPVRRKKIVEASKADEVTAAPESDVTAHYVATDEARTEEVAAPVHETHATSRSRASRHAAWLAATRSKAARSSKATKARSSKSKAKTAHSKAKTKTKASKSSKSHSSAKKSTSNKKKSTHKATAKKVTAHKASSKKHRR